MKKTALLLPALLLAGCASIALKPGADKVIVSPNKPPRGCKFLGQVSGSQGNFFTGSYTSNRNLEIGAQNDLRNRALDKGGNYVQLITNRAAFSGGAGYGSGGATQTSVMTMGNVYRCSARAIGE